MPVPKDEKGRDPVQAESHPSRFSALPACALPPYGTGPVATTKSSIHTVCATGDRSPM